MWVRNKRKLRRRFLNFYYNLNTHFFCFFPVHVTATSAHDSMCGVDLATAVCQRDYGDLQEKRVRTALPKKHNKGNKVAYSCLFPLNFYFSTEYYVFCLSYTEILSQFGYLALAWPFINLFVKLSTYIFFSTHFFISALSVYLPV